MRLRSHLGKVRSRFLSSFCRRAATLGNLGPVVTFTFDDFPRSAFTTGAKILDRSGVRATYYVAMGLMDTSNRLGEQFRLTDLHALVERGHDIAIHGFRHVSARRTRLEEFISDVADCERAISACIPEGWSNNFAYPYGEVTLAAKRLLGPRMQSSRGTIGGLNGPEIDLNLLRANALYGDVDQAGRVQRLINENQARKSWLIFYTHDVADRPSPYGCTPTMFQSAISFAAEQGAKIMTVAEVVSVLSGKVPTTHDKHDVVILQD